MLLNLSWYGVVICQPFKLCASSGCDHFIIIELVISHKQYSALCGLEGRSAEMSGFPGSSLTLYFLAFIQVRRCLEYASCDWDGCSVADSHSLEPVQLSLPHSILSAFHPVSLICQNHSFCCSFTGRLCPGAVDGKSLFKSGN